MERIVKSGINGREFNLAEIMSGMEGWQEIVNSLYDDLVGLGWDKTILQIKEKFGGLRFYIDNGDDCMWHRIFEAEAQSFKTCILCGKPGAPTGPGWILTLCEEHKVKLGKNDELLDLDSDSNSAAV